MYDTAPDDWFVFNFSLTICIYFSFMTRTFQWSDYSIMKTCPQLVQVFVHHHVLKHVLVLCLGFLSETKTRFGSAASSWHFHLSSFCTWRSPIVGASKPWHPERNKRLRLLDVVASPAEPEPPLVLVGQLVGWLIMKWNPNIWCSVAWASLPT